MVIALLIVLGLSLGSFVNALVWRLHEQEEGSKSKNLSIWHGRSMCPHCRHELSSLDLIPVFSWLLLGGRCRYCKRSINPQYPVVELLTALSFLLSYIYWPYGFGGAGDIIRLGLWLAILTGLMALLVYDLKWLLLPDKIVFPLVFLAFVHFGAVLISSTAKIQLLSGLAGGILAGSGFFYALYAFSDGRWIGGGDIKLALIYGFLLASPLKSALVLFSGSILGTILVVPALIKHRTHLKSQIPFGPLLIIGTFLIYLFGSTMIAWFKRQFLII